MQTYSLHMDPATLTSGGGKGVVGSWFCGQWYVHPFHGRLGLHRQATQKPTCTMRNCTPRHCVSHEMDHRRNSHSTNKKDYETRSTKPSCMIRIFMSPCLVCHGQDGLQNHNPTPRSHLACKGGSTCKLTVCIWTPPLLHLVWEREWWGCGFAVNGTCTPSPADLDSIAKQHENQLARCETVSPGTA